MPILNRLFMDRGKILSMMGYDENNPVVMLNGTVWHIVEDGRSAIIAYCGKNLHDKRAHSRLRTIGETAVCLNCRKNYAPLQERD